MSESPTIETFIIYTDIDSGTEHIVRRLYFADDHEDAARQAFKSVEGSRIRIRELLTFDGPPRRWSPDFRVTELL